MLPERLQWRERGDTPLRSGDVTQRETVTIDASVVIDFIEPAQDRHALAKELFALHRSGAIELALATSGTAFDFTPERAAQVRAVCEAQGVATTPQLAYPGVLYPGEGAYPGAGVHGFGEAWRAILDNWKSHEGPEPGTKDALHVETHVLLRRDVFVTDDRALLAMCRRLTDYGFAIRAVRLEEYVEGRR
jgi:hypothetical protein